MFSKEGGGTRVGETISPLPFTLYSDPDEAGRGVHALRGHGGVAARRCRSSTTACPSGAPTGCATASLAHLRYHRAGAAKSGVPMAPYIDNLVLRCGDGVVMAARSTTWWRAPSAGCC